MKDFLAGFFSTLAGACIIMLSSCQHSYAQTDEEYVRAVGKEFRSTWDSPSRFYGHVEVQVLVTDSGAVLYRQIKPEPSSNSVLTNAFIAEVLRAANAVLDKSIEPGLVFPFSFTRKFPVYNTEPSPWEGMQ